MEKFQELPKEKIGVISVISTGFPSFVGGWLKFFESDSEILFDNPTFSCKVIKAGLWLSGSLAYCYEIVREDGGKLDIDRYYLSPSGDAILINKEIEKNFPEHHSQKLPSYYKSENLKIV